MELIKNYDKEKGEIIMEEPRIIIYQNVEEVKAKHIMGDMLVTLEVSLFNGLNVSDDPEDENESKGIILGDDWVLYRNPTGMEENERKFDSFIINELGFKWLETSPDFWRDENNLVKKTFSKAESEVIKEKIIRKSVELDIQPYAAVSSFNMKCPMCHRITDMRIRFHDDRCIWCGHKLPNKYNYIFLPETRIRYIPKLRMTWKYNAMWQLRYLERKFFPKLFDYQLAIKTIKNEQTMSYIIMKRIMDY